MIITLFDAPTRPGKERRVESVSTFGVERKNRERRERGERFFREFGALLTRRRKAEAPRLALVLSCCGLEALLARRRKAEAPRLALSFERSFRGLEVVNVSTKSGGGEFWRCS